MTIETLPHDAADFLTDEETIAAYITESLESDDPKVIGKALGAVARARGMTQLAQLAQLAQDTGITHEVLYRALSATGNPEFGTVLKVVHALGFRFAVLPGTPAPA